MPRSSRVTGKECFVTCRSLRSAVFNKGLKEIGDQAFLYTALENVQLPSSVEWIGSGAFLLHDVRGGSCCPRNSGRWDTPHLRRTTAKHSRRK